MPQIVNQSQPTLQPLPTTVPVPSAPPPGHPLQPLPPPQQQLPPEQQQQQQQPKKGLSLTVSGLFINSLSNSDNVIGR